MSDLCTPLPGESLPARARRYAEDMMEAHINDAAVDEVAVLLIQLASALDRSYDDKQKAARLVVCGQCGHQVYSTVKGTAS